MAYPEPTEVAPWYLRNITQALEYKLGWEEITN